MGDLELFQEIETTHDPKKRFSLHAFLASVDGIPMMRLGFYKMRGTVPGKNECVGRIYLTMSQCGKLATYIQCANAIGVSNDETSSNG
jgi:hypothetical protein